MCLPHKRVSLSRLSPNDLYCDGRWRALVNNFHSWYAVRIDSAPCQQTTQIMADIHSKLYTMLSYASFFDTFHSHVSHQSALSNLDLKLRKCIFTVKKMRFFRGTRLFSSNFLFIWKKEKYNHSKCTLNIQNSCRRFFFQMKFNRETDLA